MHCARGSLSVLHQQLPCSAHGAVLCEPQASRLVKGVDITHSQQEGSDRISLAVFSVMPW